MTQLIHPATLDPVELLKQCEVRFTRRSGPGGQHRNKVETAAILTHTPSGILAEANERRSQAENRIEALFRLRLRLAVQVRTTPGEQPSERWRSRLVGGRIAVNPTHEDFPSLIAEALDVLSAESWQMPEAAGRLGCTASQLGKLLQREPAVWTAVNKARQEQGLRPLH